MYGYSRHLQVTLNSTTTHNTGALDWSHLPTSTFRTTTRSALAPGAFHGEVGYGFPGDQPAFELAHPLAYALFPTHRLTPSLLTRDYITSCSSPRIPPSSSSSSFTSHTYTQNGFHSLRIPPRQACLLHPYLLHQGFLCLCPAERKGSPRSLRCKHSVFPTDNEHASDTTLQAGKHAKDEPRLLGCTENELGIRKWLEDQGHELVTTSDKEGANSTFDKHIPDAEVIITTP